MLVGKVKWQIYAELRIISASVHRKLGCHRMMHGRKRLA